MPLDEESGCPISVSKSVGNGKADDSGSDHLGIISHPLNHYTTHWFSINEERAYNMSKIGVWAEGSRK